MNEALSDELLTRVVHKFARSLGAMRSTTQALLNAGDADPGFRREMLGDMDTEMRELQRLIDNVVQFRALAKGTFRLRPRVILPSMMLWQIVEHWRDASTVKSLEWRIEIPDELSPVLVDTEKLQQILDNILANLLRDSQRGSQVHVSARTVDHQLEFRVDADASRVGEGEYERIFELFYTGVQQGRFPTGTGLGLHVARELAKAHGGSLLLQPPATQGGSLSWIVRLPLTVEGAKEAVAPAQPNGQEPAQPGASPDGRDDQLSPRP